MKQNNAENEADSAKFKAQSAKIIKWKKLPTKQNWSILKSKFSDL